MYVFMYAVTTLAVTHLCIDVVNKEGCYLLLKYVLTLGLNNYHLNLNYRLAQGWVGS